MSKTVIIPDCMNPFEVIVNGKHYSYPAGTTQEVPDDVAAVIEAHEQVHEEQTAPPPSDGGDSLGYVANMAVRMLEESGQVGRSDHARLSICENKELSAGKEMVNVKSSSPQLTVGEKYIVTVNGEKHEIVCKQFNSTIYIGNGALNGSIPEDNTGEPFFATEIGSGTNWMLRLYVHDPVTKDYSTERVCTVEKVIEIVHPMEMKYLPTVAITSAEYPQSGDPVALSDEESAQLDAVVGSPVIIKAACGGTQIAGFAAYIIGMDGSQLLSLSVPLVGALAFRRTETGWMMGSV